MEQVEGLDTEITPLLGPIQENIDSVGIRYLLIQHLSSAWGDRTAEFALYLYLIGYYKDTLLPSSIFGFSMTLTGILLSRWAGSLVDKIPKLSVVRWSIFVQKTSALAAYTCVLALRSVDARSSTPGLLLFLLLALAGCVVHLSNICISIAVERDWTVCISGGSSPRLAKVNTYMRQINLLCKLLAPLFVSFLTVTFDADDRTPSLSLFVLAAVSVLSMFFELYWIQIVYDRFPMLAAEQLRKETERRVVAAAALPTASSSSSSSSSSAPSLRSASRDWLEFTRLPVFLSSLSISLLYLTVLSFDGTMLGYLKTLDFHDDFLAAMRGLCVLTGLLGTVITAPLENRLGSVRAGSWSIWSMVVCLLPVMASFYIFGPRSTIGALLLFGGMALSRIGLWSFDLIQTKQLQEALATHARRNTIMALQYSMQSVADLMKYVLTALLSHPPQFRWAGLVSFLSVSSGAVVYMAYLKRERGHVFHTPAELVRKLI